MTPEAFQAAYFAVGHKIQSGIAFLMGLPNQRYRSAEPKHLRVGLNCAMRDHGSLADLLIRKGIITAEEYRAAIIEGLHKEAEMIRAECQAEVGDKARVDLG